MIAISLVLCGTLFALGLAIYAVREREWALAIFMVLIAALAVAAAYVAYDCLGQHCIFDGGTHSELIRARGAGDA